MRIIVTLLSMTLFACGPLGMIPGGKLGGVPSNSPVFDWASLDGCEIIQVETGGLDPYSINIWAAGTGGTLYLASGSGPDSRWVRNIGADPAVRVQACDNVYPMRAMHTTSDEDLEAFLAAVKRKYDWKREKALEYKDWVFRLDSI